MSDPRGIRNANPMNLEYHEEVTWQGLATPPSDGRFCRFRTPQYGIRAGYRTVMTYQAKDGCKTIRQIISRFAPSVENNTAAYIAAICTATGGEPDDEVDVDSIAFALPFSKGVILHENGVNPYSDDVITEGLRMAGISDAKPTPLVKQKPFLAQVGGGVALVTGGATQIAQQAPTVKGWADQLSAYAGAPIVQHVVTALLTVAGGLAIMGIAATAINHFRSA